MGSEITTQSYLRQDLSKLMRIIAQKQERTIWKFYFFYFLMRNKELRRNQIAEIEDLLSYYELPQKNWQNLDENLTVFILGYKILQDFGKEKQFKEKVHEIKIELEKHWNDNNKNYFNNTMYTLLILLSDKENPHKLEIIEEFKKTKDYALLSVVFMIMEGDNQYEDLKIIYENIIRKVKEEYYDIRDIEKISVAWILWKYRRLQKSKIKKIRDIISPYLSTSNELLVNGLQNGILNVEYILAYDLLYDFEKGTRIAFEEVPLMFRIIGSLNGIIVLSFILYIDFRLWEIGYLHGKGFLSFDIIINTIIVLISMLMVFLGWFLIYEIGFKGICSNKEIKEKLKELVLEKYFWGFVIGAIVFGFVSQLI